VNRSGFDPVSLEVMWSRLVNITEECWVTIWRTAFSTIIGEAQDFGCELLDAGGESLAHSPRSMPVFNLTLPRAVKALLREFPSETLRDGDVLITNDPWICAGHLFDVALVTPVFRDGRVVALVGSIAHCSDIGGTRDYQRVREVYEEGLQIPPMKLFEAGALNRTLFSLIERNVRKSDMVLGDIHAQHGANLVAAERLLAFMDAYDLSDLEALATEVQHRAEVAMREAIGATPDGTYRARVGFDGVGDPLELAVAMHVEGDAMRVVWEAPPQLPRGGINCTLNYTAAHTVYALKCILTPDIPSNAGCFRPISVEAPEGSILNCRYPAAVNQRTQTGWYCAPAIFAALADVLPDRVQAFTGLPMGAGAYGLDGDGSVYNDHLFQGGGQGASLHGDGRARCSTRPRPATRRSRCSRRARRSWSRRRRSSPTAAARAAPRRPGAAGERAQAARRRSSRAPVAAPAGHAGVDAGPARWSRGEPGADRARAARGAARGPRAARLGGAPHARGPLPDRDAGRQRVR
jgi:5-oxoprolinase (ATP-hydrolysing)